MNQQGILFLCATPIGNLEDITLRVLRILREVDLIAAEDTRHTRKLLAHYDIHTPMVSYREHNRRQMGRHLLNLLAAGLKVALVSDAGMPGISDPGEELVSLAIGRGIPVVPLPGPNAALTALVASGLPTSSFCFEGFLPTAAGARRRKLEELKGERRTIIFYEAPHRLLESLSDMVDIWGERQIAVARELTKKYEEIWRGTLPQAVEHFRLQSPRGEFTLVVAGAREGEVSDTRDESWLGLSLKEHVALLQARGMDKKEAIREVARQRGIPRREVYNQVVRDSGANS
ncbi:16S rRNA (cytidine(1402)-2'-O)-methyltransferase [Desulfofundulus salinus]|uniref:Ribosomal RNA small subunit methyltransferase I n=1 Tax=Desulfofundulus salinus TaxID=2419843 RepID=A0A494WXU2_9FIRM|nr:16S rRNA (cytidine(1402)-2'-O)-methyltransferase [Desulfofundulus salinum]RKO67961.1 16S rRNA (cytidine(1402)-2'-O)-methyltransferase [Desulfofundulus salinum]